MHASRTGIGGLLLTMAIMQAHSAFAAGRPKTDKPSGLDQMREEIARQNSRIEQLERLLARQSALLETLQRQLEAGSGSAPASAKTAENAVLEPVRKAPAQPGPVSGQAPAPAKPVESVTTVAGFRLSGDFRYRLDMALRSSNSAAPPLQNIRGRYRLRMNVDRELDRRFRFHSQLSTGALNNYLTNDQDFAGIAAKHPFSVAEAYIDFHPNDRFSLRGGRMEEVFADGMRLLWDDDIRFNGFQQILRVPLRSNVLGLQAVEFRAGQYILSNPNVAVLTPGSPYVLADFPPGRQVRDANLFHQGVILSGDLGGNWSHQVTGDIQVYRNPNQIQLSSLPAGFPVLISNAIGIALSGPPPAGLGTATTSPGGAIYTAPNFQIGRLVYHVGAKALKFGAREMPFWFDLQMSRNTGTSMLRDAIMASANVGAVRRPGDVRFLYQYAIKDANALISQFTDDDLGTGTGVNIAVHALRFDLGLTKFLQWQNLLFIQNERRPSNPAESFFVPLPRGASPTFRFEGQLLFVW